MRISDWSSDVCSSDLKRTVGFAADALASSTRGSFDKSHGSQATSNEVSWPLLSWIPERFTDRPTGDRTTYSFGVTRPAETCRARPLSRSASPLRRSEENTSELQSLMRI